LVLAGCRDGGALDGLPQGREGCVTAVLSGDEIALDAGETVKLAGIDAPKGDAPYAEAAREALDRLVGGRRVVLFFSGARKDALGRTVAQVQDAETRRWVEGALLDAGAARVRTSTDDRTPATPMLAREASARRARRGLWTIPQYEVRLPQELGYGDGGFTVLEGRAVHVGQGRGALYIDFSEDWRGAVSVSIPDRAVRDFRTAGLDLYDLRGRLIRVRGLLRNNRLTVDHPEQIELLTG
jgi:endonuclease YncB( thermonuclease family)